MTPTIRVMILAFLVLLFLTGFCYSQSQAVFRSFEMISNGNGTITDVVGFDITRAPHDHGAYSADWYRDVLLGASTIINLPTGMQAGGGWFFVVAGPNDIGNHEDAVNRWTRNGTNDDTITGNTYEIRFTESGGKALMIYKTLVDVPFELWYLSDTPDDPADDIRMFPWIYDDNENDLFDFKLDHSASGAFDDPYSDWLYFILPDDRTPGQNGYDQFVQAAMNGNYNYEGEEHLVRVVLMNWNRHQFESVLGAGDGPEDATPETGTIFRLTAGQMITIDIKPGSDPNSINCENLKGVIPVAILSTDDFDASQVDPTSVRFGPARASIAHNRGHVKDVDLDGDLDLVVHFRFDESGLQCTDYQGSLAGETRAGLYFVGYDDVNMVPQGVACGLDDPGIHEHNQVKLLVSSDGRLAANPAQTAFGFFPRKTCDQYIFTSGIWIGGLVEGTAIVAEASHNTEFAPSEIGATGDVFRVFNSMLPNEKKNWPPEFSDPAGKPIIVSGAQNLVVEYNDLDGSPMRDVNMPLGVEIRQRSLAFNNSSVQNSLIFIWEVTNISNKKIQNAYFGFWSDNDVGNLNTATDDQASFVNDMAITWDYDFSEDNFAEQPAIVGFDFLETPDDVGIANGVTFINGGPNPDPNQDGVQYDYLSGVNQFETNVVSDVRTLLTTGPFDLDMGESAVIAGALLFGRAPEGTTELAVDANYPFRPDSNDPVLAELLSLQTTVRDFYDLNLRGVSLLKSGPFDAAKTSDLLPKGFALEQNHPNPFNPETEIRFALPRPTHVVLKIYNVLGHEVRTLVSRKYEGGYHRVLWDSKDNSGNLVSSGIYLYQIKAEDFVQVRKMSLVR